IGLPEERLARIESAVALRRYALAPDLEVRHKLPYSHPQAPADCGRYEEALAELEAVRSWLVAGTSDAVTRLVGTAAQLELLCLVGKPEAAEQLLLELMVIARRTASQLFILRLTRLHARIRAERRDAQSAMVLADRAVHGCEQSGDE